MNSIFLFSAVLFAVFFSILLSQAASEEKVDAIKLFERKCSICHSTDRPKSKRKTMKEWKKTVNRMNQYADILTREEETLIIKYLAQNYGK